MKLLIIEDERPSFVRLTSVINKLGGDWQIDGPLTTTESVKKYFADGGRPDLIISDVRLTDGLVFSAFDSLDITAHIIFTLAYSDYTVNAFSTNGIQYLLKPIIPEELAAAIDKTLWTGKCRLSDVRQFAAGLRRPYIRKRFLVPWLDGFEVVDVSSISHIYSDDAMLYLVCFDGRRYNLSMSIDECNIQLDAENFFLVNDSYIVNINAIQRLNTAWGSYLKLYLRDSAETEILVSRERALGLRLWLDQAGTSQDVR